MIDNVMYDIPIPMYISEVKDIFIKSFNFNGCTIVVNTKINYSKMKNFDFSNYYFNDDDYYNYDAILYEHLKTGKPNYLNDYRDVKDSKKVLNIYLNQYYKYKSYSNCHLDVLNYFQENYTNNEILLKILSDYEAYS